MDLLAPAAQCALVVAGGPVGRCSHLSPGNGRLGAFIAGGGDWS